MEKGVRKLFRIIRYSISNKKLEESYKDKYFALYDESEQKYMTFKKENEYLSQKLLLENSNEQNKNESILSIKLVDCDLSVRCLNYLKVGNIETIGDLIQYSYDDLIRFRNLGKKSLMELREFLQKYGLHFKRKW